jgi:hypothetical protein
MATINPNKEEFYNYEDRKLLISLLNEYSEKLSLVCDRIDKYKENSRTLTLLQIGLMFPIVALLLIVTLSGMLNLQRYIMEGAVNTILSFSVLILSTLFLINEIFHNKRKLRLLERDASTIAIKLEKVIRLASQIQEHALNNVVNRIELDLRLADAESALDHYYEAKQSKK